MLDGLRQFIADVVSPHAHEDRSLDDTGETEGEASRLLDQFRGPREGRP